MKIRTPHCAIVKLSIEKQVEKGQIIEKTAAALASCCYGKVAILPANGTFRFHHHFSVSRDKIVVFWMYLFLNRRAIEFRTATQKTDLLFRGWCYLHSRCSRIECFKIKWRFLIQKNKTGELDWGQSSKCPWHWKKKEKKRGRQRVLDSQIQFPTDNLPGFVWILSVGIGRKIEVPKSRKCAPDPASWRCRKRSPLNEREKGLRFLFYLILPKTAKTYSVWECLPKNLRKTK